MAQNLIPRCGLAIGSEHLWRCGSKPNHVSNPDFETKFKSLKRSLNEVQTPLYVWFGGTSGTAISGLAPITVHNQDAVTIVGELGTLRAYPSLHASFQKFYSRFRCTRSFSSQLAVLCRTVRRRTRLVQCNLEAFSLVCQFSLVYSPVLPCGVYLCICT